MAEEKKEVMEEIKVAEVNKAPEIKVSEMNKEEAQLEKLTLNMM